MTKTRLRTNTNTDSKFGTTFYCFIEFCLYGQGVTMACPGDSGSPILWKDKADDNRNYVFGALVQGSGKCFTNKTIRPNNAIWVPYIVDWILSEGGQDLKECLP